MPITVANIEKMLNSLYPKGAPENLAMMDHVLFGILPKEEGFFGKDWRLRIIFGDGGGRSADVDKAVSGSNAPDIEEFVITRKSDYAEFMIQGEAIEASENDLGACAEGLQVTMDAKFNRLGASIGHALYRDGTGSMGQVGSIAGNVVTLKNVDDVQFFERYQVLTASAGAVVTNAQRAGTMIVTAVDENLGKVTCGAGLVGALANNDYLFVDGDRKAGAITAHSQMVKMSGLDHWLDPTVGGLGASDVFYSVDRSLHTRLLGILLAPTVPYATVEQGIVDLQSIVNSRGGRVDYCLLHPVQYRKFKEEVGAQTEYNKTVLARVAPGLKALVSYKFVAIDGDKGEIKVVSDPDGRKGFGYALTSSTWKIKSLYGIPRFFAKDGNKLLREIKKDQYEGLMGQRANLGCRAPGWNGRVVLP